MEKTTINDMIDSIGSNVKSIKYRVDKKMWTVEFKSDLPPDEIDTENLIDFLING